MSIVMPKNVSATTRKTKELHLLIKMAADGNFCTIGSANLNARSLRWDREVNAVIVDKEVTKELDTIFESQKKRCFKLTEKKWNEWRTPWQKLKGKLGFLLSPFL